MKLAQAIAGRRLLVCVGSGGVGKTTTAAALGLRAAMEGKKVLVLTIDPARRLANSLGLKRFGNDETRIDLSALGARGELWAMMLDHKKTFDDLIRRVSPDEQSRDKVLSNRIYRAIADTIAGSQDHMAAEQLHDVVLSRRYDLVVLDTPPVKNALDFLEAPSRLTRFFDKRVMKWFLTPYDEGKVFGRLLSGTSAVLFRLLGYIFGKEFLSELSDFFISFQHLYEGFRERHEQVERIFRDAGTAFIVVCAPTEPSIDVAHFFFTELTARQMPAIGAIVNQRHSTLGRPIDTEQALAEQARALSTDLPPETASRLLARLGASHRRLRELSSIEEGLVGGLQRKLSRGQQLWSVPRFEHEVHDIQALSALGGRLFDGG
jgi:anion-transporting  ArsA/GET3 family ATPase